MTANTTEKIKEKITVTTTLTTPPGLKGSAWVSTRLSKGWRAVAIRAQVEPAVGATLALNIYEKTDQEIPLTDNISGQSIISPMSKSLTSVLAPALGDSMFVVNQMEISVSHDLALNSRLAASWIALVPDVRIDVYVDLERIIR